MQIEILSSCFFYQSSEAYYLGLEMRNGAEILINSSARARSGLFEAVPEDDCLIFWYNHERDVSHGKIGYKKMMRRLMSSQRLRQGCF